MTTILFLLLSGFFSVGLLVTWADDIRSCPNLSPRTIHPTEVRDLRVDDIGIIMAMGDSFTTAYGANFLRFFEAKISQESRGISFSIGGDPGAHSLANFFRHYRNDLLGFSKGNQFIEFCAQGRFCPVGASSFRPLTLEFNAAISGSSSENLDLQVRYLLREIGKMAVSPRLDNWKLVTIFIGIEDLCRDGCNTTITKGQKRLASSFEKNLKLAIWKLYRKLRRLVVNVLLLPDLSQLPEFAVRSRRCNDIQQLLASRCPCAMITSPSSLWKLRKTVAEFNKRILLMAKRLNAYSAKASEKRGEPREFAVIVTPTLSDTDFLYDIPEYFASKVDCFHFSNAAHKSLATKLWRSLFLPFALKSSRLTKEDLMYCPTDGDRIRVD